MSPISRPGVTCDLCNSYFGQKVEDVAVRSILLMAFRLISSAPSKKGKLHRRDRKAGLFAASGRPGHVDLVRIPSRVKGPAAVVGYLKFSAA